MILEVKDNRIKTVNITVSYLIEKLEEDIVPNYMLPVVLSQTTNINKTVKEVLSQKYKLYNASITVDRGEIENLSIISYSLDVVNPKFINEDFSIFEEAVKMLSDLIYTPYISDVSFNAKKIQELESMKLDIEDEYLICEYNINRILNSGSIRGIQILDKIEDIPMLNKKDIYRYHNKLITKGKSIITICGNYNTYMKNIVKKYIVDNDKKIYIEYPKYTSKKTRIEKDIEKCVQAKITFGINFKEKDIKNRDIYRLCNIILGECITSKMYRIIREKYNLSYITSSKFNIYSNQIIAKIDPMYENIEFTINIFNQIMNSSVTVDELERAKIILINNLQDAYDISDYILDNEIFNIITGEKDTIKSRINKVKNVTLKDIQKQYSNMRLDAIYIYGGA